LSGSHLKAPGFAGGYLLQAPYPNTLKRLYIFLHECAHAHLDHGHNGNTPRHVEELEAEMWAHDKMKGHGLEIPPEITAKARDYVAQKIVQAERRGAKNINPEAIKFAGEHLAKVRTEYETICGKSKHPRAAQAV
jgi:hypothetical protein